MNKLLILCIAALWLTAASKEKIDPSNYTLTVQVGTATTEPVKASRKHDLTHDPKCEHPIVASAACKNTAVAETETEGRLIKLDVTIGDTVYSLVGKTLLAPDTYRARIIYAHEPSQVGGLQFTYDSPREVEFLVADKKGHFKAIAFKIVSKMTIPKKP